MVEDDQVVEKSCIEKYIDRKGKRGANIEGPKEATADHHDPSKCPLPEYFFLSAHPLFFCLLFFFSLSLTSSLFYILFLLSLTSPPPLFFSISLIHFTVPSFSSFTHQVISRPPLLIVRLLIYPRPEFWSLYYFIPRFPFLDLFIP